MYERLESTPSTGDSYGWLTSVFRFKIYDEAYFDCIRFQKNTPTTTATTSTATTTSSTTTTKKNHWISKANTTILNFPQFWGTTRATFALFPKVDNKIRTHRGNDTPVFRIEIVILKSRGSLRASKSL